MTPQSQRKGIFVVARNKYFRNACQYFCDDGGTVEDAYAVLRDVYGIEPMPKDGKPKPKPIINPEELKKRREEEAERREKLAELAAKYSTSFGIPWENIGWHELPAMGRDGDIARAIIAAGPAHVPNDGRKVHDVLTTMKLHKVIDEARSRQS